MLFHVLHTLIEGLSRGLCKMQILNLWSGMGPESLFSISYMVMSTQLIDSALSTVNRVEGQS